MTDQDYIRKAIELADGWEPVDAIAGGMYMVIVTLPGEDGEFKVRIRDFTGLWLDALVAQLVRQVDALAGERYVWLTVYRTQTDLASPDKENIWQKGPDRTMNTIKAIVDSEVLLITQSA